MVEQACGSWEKVKSCQPTDLGFKTTQINLQNPFAKPPKKDSGPLRWSNNHRQMAQIPFFCLPKKDPGLRGSNKIIPTSLFSASPKRIRGFERVQDHRVLGRTYKPGSPSSEMHPEKKTHQSVCEGGADGGKSQRSALLHRSSCIACVMTDSPLKTFRSGLAVESVK